MAKVRAAWSSPAAAPEPQHATIRGPARLCLQPALAASLTAHRR
jgi:rod shape-determining protein MreB